MLTTDDDVVSIDNNDNINNSNNIDHDHDHHCHYSDNYRRTDTGANDYAGQRLCMLFARAWRVRYRPGDDVRV